MAISYIGADVDCKMTELAVEENKKIVYRKRIPTTISDLRSELERFGGRKILIFEECPMAGWLYRNLRDYATQVIVSDPRRNGLICKDGEKDDRIDAGKLAALYRGGFIREVHHPQDDEHQALREAVALYHDRVRQKVREINKFHFACYGHGLTVLRKDFLTSACREEWFGELSKELREQLEIRAIGLDAAICQVEAARKLFVGRAKKFEIIRYWNELPGIKWVRSSTMFAYLDTPWRFESVKELWKYCGVGLWRYASGSDRNGAPKSGKVKMYPYVNRRLKACVLGAALDAIRQDDNEFSEHYKRMVQDGVSPANARHTVGRKLLTVMFGMWKTQTRYVPGLRN